ncbi:MAG: ADP-ribosylglycohydrolase family protein [Clostridia bacterium]|nr:ADP-ribosylglycohydrolase family protein [Clostridia bacterium]
MLSQRIISLRKKFSMSQEKMAEIFNVSRQSVQKWESGAAVPDVEKLIAMARHFKVSLDFLLCDEDNRSVEEQRLDREIIPQYKSAKEWELYSSSLSTEYDQCIDEGKDVENLKGLFDSISALEPSKEKEQMADVLFNIIRNAKTKADYRYNEPSDYDSIQNLLTDFDADLTKVPTDDVLYNKIKGAWVGRICGCLLGKPIECIYTEELIPLLKETGNYPMHRYIRNADLNEDIYKKYRFQLRDKCYEDTITAAPVDDDTNYVVMAQVLIEKYGRDFTAKDVANLWLERQPKDAYCTAERVAFMNFVNGYCPPDSAEYKNPYREWIGAQIRGDYYGYINPGDIKTAAKMAFKDASISHVKNGIYGEMFISAMIAAAAVLDDVKQVILAGLSQIPKTSRLYCEITKLIKDFDGGLTQEKCFENIHKQYDQHVSHDWCHTISNAVIVCAALLYGKGDYSKSICMAVQTGFDTDCNGATVGSVIGMMKGIDGIEKRWYQPINNKLETSIFGVGTIDIDEAVNKTIEHINR